MRDRKKMKDRIKRRLYARCRWVLETPAHFGSGTSTSSDMSILRDSQGKPFIPGTSIAGSGRNYLARMLNPLKIYQCGWKAEPPPLQALFGIAKEPDKNEDKKNLGNYGNMSALYVTDALCIELYGVHIRDGVRIDEITGVAAPHAKFDIEVVDRGSIFQFCMNCIIRETDPEEEMVDYFLALLDGFQKGKIRIGGKTQRGFGKGKTEKWDIIDLHMNCSADVQAWLQSSINSKEIWLRLNRGLSPRPLTKEKRNFFTIHAKLSLKTSLLIRKASERPDTLSCNAPDLEYVQSGGKPVVPGTSLCGVLRHRVAFIARRIGWKNEEVESIIEEMFGPIHEAENRSNNKKSLWISRIQVEEEIIKEVIPRTISRVAIDRFTGGSLKSALFTEMLLYPQKSLVHLEIKITLEEPHDTEIGLLLLALRDLACGNVAIGGEVGNGRGTFAGKTAELHLYREEQSKKWNIDFDEQKLLISSNDREELQNFIDKTKQAPDKISGSRRPISLKDKKP